MNKTGIIMDNKLNFLEYASKLRLIVNRKLFSIKKLFYLCTSVKLQFFKYFILPYFDFCILFFLFYLAESKIIEININFNKKYKYLIIKLYADSLICMSIYIYFPKLTLQKINNSFNFCLFKLFKFKIKSEMDNLNEFNNFLEK